MNGRYAGSKYVAKWRPTNATDTESNIMRITKCQLNTIKGHSYHMRPLGIPTLAASFLVRVSSHMVIVGQDEYVKTIWSDSITTERHLIGDLTIGRAKIHFLDDLVFHVQYDEGDILTDYMVMSWSQLDQKLSSSILV